ncbi:ankyrin-3-like [Lytechinus pictus]|uniref:ankyrin-3-like n=1 Tax=Lytechinus pictus TaxID=7653 RepID=UPI0030B9DD07
MPGKVNSQDIYHLAHAGYAQKLNEYLSKNANKSNINEFSKDGATPLILSVQGSRVDPAAPGTSHVECCELLLSHGANPNLSDKLGRTALHWAVFYKKPEFVKVLLKEECDITKEDKKGQNVMQFAIRMNAAKCLQLICETMTDEKILSKPSTSVGTPLIQATKLGHQECCQILLQSGANIDIQDQAYFDKTALLIATELNNPDIVEMLIKYDANIQAEDAQGNTCLHLSCTLTSPKCLELVLQGCKKAPDLVGKRNKAGLTPLMVACQQGLEKHIELLLKYESPASIQDEQGKTALHYVTGKGLKSSAELLVATDSGLPWTQDAEGRTPLHLAVIEGKKDLVEFLIEKSGVNAQDNQGHTPIHWAVVCGVHDLIETLVDHGGDPSLIDDHGASPLHYAAQMCGDPAVSEIGILCLKALIKRGAKVNAIDNGHKTPLLWASSAGSSEACKLLKEAGADATLADLDGLTALHCAVTCDHPSCVETLLKECDAAVDVPDKNGCTPLFYAASMEQLGNVQTLLESGASPNHTDNKGKSPMHCAAGAASLDALRLLQEHDGSMNQAGSEGETPFHEALQKGDLDIIKFMIENGCKPGSPDKNGRTPLHIAAVNANVDLCRYLVDLKANIDAFYKSDNGLQMTPLDCAWDSGAVSCMDYLASIGAKRGRELDHKKTINPTNNLLNPPHPSYTTKQDKSNVSGPKTVNRTTSRDEKQDKEGTKDQKEDDVRTSPRNEASIIEKSPYMKAPHSSYDHAERRNEEEQREAEERKRLRSASVEKKMADWESYIKEHVNFLDDLLEVEHERLESIQSHAIEEKESLVKKLEEIREEMEKRVEKKNSEAEKLREEKRKQAAEEKRLMDERWKKIQQHYLNIDSKVSDQITIHRQATQTLDTKMTKFEKKRIRREKTDMEVSSRKSPSRNSNSDDPERIQKHADWLKRKNKEYLEKKNAVKVQAHVKVDSAVLNAHLKRTSTPKCPKSPVPSRVDHSHRRRSPSPPHDRIQYQRQELEKQRRQLEEQHQFSKHRPGTVAGRTSSRSTSSPSPSKHSSSSPHPPTSSYKGPRKLDGGRTQSAGEVTEGRKPSGPDAIGPTSHKLAQLRRSHGNNLNRKLWPKSWELQDKVSRSSDEGEEIFDLKQHFSPRWNGQLRPRHVLQFRSVGASRQEGQAEA